MQMNAVSPASPTPDGGYVGTKSWIRCYNNIKTVDMGSSARGTCSPIVWTLSSRGESLRGQQDRDERGKEGSERQKEQKR